MKKIYLFFVMMTLLISHGALAATPTFTATETSTVEATSTPSITPSVTQTNTVSPTLSATPSITPTNTMSPTITQTATISPTSTTSPTSTEVVNVLVSVNHNYFYPLRGQTLELNNLNTLHGEVTIRVYNQSGTLIKTLLDNVTVSRGIVPVWDGKNESGDGVASGVYVVMVKGKKLHKRFRVALIK